MPPYQSMSIDAVLVETNRNWTILCQKKSVQHIISPVYCKVGGGGMFYILLIDGPNRFCFTLKSQSTNSATKL
ncbi:hypothetical protein BLOT_006663 [Blomia tropicalis]|nr:hypothetical protein BLOT_006663 [Blomia tropicalis]